MSTFFLCFCYYFFKAPNVNSTSSPVPPPSSESAFSASNGNEISKSNAVISDSAAIDHQLIPTSLAASELGTDLDIGSVVQVDIPGSANKLFGVIRWMGILRDRDKPFVGVELVSFVVSIFSCSNKHIYGLRSVCWIAQHYTV